VKIYITRHGETEWNREGKMQGWKNSNLTQKGIENAKSLGGSLKNIDFDFIYCSPLGRAVDTAKCIRGSKETKIITNESLKEMGFGSWEGMEHSKIEELYPEQQSNFWNSPHLYKPVDGESFEELLNRARKALNDIISAGGENVMVVTHAAFIKAVYTVVKNSPLQDFWGQPFMYDTCLNIIEVRNNEMKFIMEADVSHLG
jgi:probable phosphoglycerate mutase